MTGDRAVTSIRDWLTMASIFARFSSVPSTEKVRNFSQASPRMRIECSILLMRIGRMALSSKLPWLPAKATAVSSAITWIQTITMASHWVGLTLPGMIEEPGSLAGRISSPKPQRGPEASQRMSLAIFISATAASRTAPMAATIASSEPWAANLLGAVTKGRPVSRAISAAMAALKPSGALSPVPTAVPPAASR